MEFTLFRPLVAAFVSAVLAGNTFGASPVGHVSAKGPVRIDSVEAAETATLFEGSRLETGVASSAVVLMAGGRFTMGPHSLARVFASRVVLERGSAQAGSVARLDAAGLSLRPDAGAEAHLRVLSGSRVAVQAARGSVQVWRGETRIASVRAGTALELTARNEANQMSSVTGKLRRSGDVFLLTDEATQTIFELRGDLAKFIGKRVEVRGHVVNGAKPLGGATLVMEVPQSPVPLVTTLPAAAAGSSKALITGITILSIAGVGLGVGLTSSADEDTISRQ